MNFIAEHWWLWLAASFILLILDLVLMWLFVSTDSERGSIRYFVGMGAVHALLGSSVLALILSVVANLVKWAVALE